MPRTSHAYLENPVIKEGLFWAGSFILLTAGWWAPRLQQISGHSSFITIDSAVLAGSGLLFARLCQWILPAGIVSAAENFGRWTGRNLIWIAPLFFAAFLAGLMLVNRAVLHSFMNSADEHSCLFLAECLRRGRLFVEPHPMSEFFNVVHVGNRDGKWFSVYPPGWPLIWAAGRTFRVEDWLNPVMACIATFFFYLSGKRVFGKTAALTGLFLAAVSPFFMFTSASYFSHTTCLLAISVFIYAFLRWMELRDAGKGGEAWAALAAFAAGYGMNTRYLTMAAIVAPFLIWHALRLIRRRTAWQKSDTVFASVFGFLFILIFLHNFAVTGKFHKAPNKYDKSWERLGFRDDYTPLDAVVFIVTRFFYLADWLAPAIIGLFLASSGLKSSLPMPARLVRWGFWYPVLAYTLYFSWGGNQYGPRYYYEGIPLLGLAVGAGLRDRWLKGPAGGRKFLLGLIIFSLFNNGYLFYKQGLIFEKVSVQRKALYVLAENEAQRPAVVFIKGFIGQELIMTEDDSIRNGPFLDAGVLYARDLGDGRDQELMRLHFPGRTAYRGTFDRQNLKAKLEKISG